MYKTYRVAMWNPNDKYSGKHALVPARDAKHAKQWVEIRNPGWKTGRAVEVK